MSTQETIRELLEKARDGVDEAMNALLEVRNRTQGSAGAGVANELRQEAYSLYKRIISLKELK